MENSLKEQEKLGIKLDKAQLIGVQDAFADKSKLSDQEIEQTLQAFEAREEVPRRPRWTRTLKTTKRKAKPTAIPAKEKGVKTSSTGLVYKVEKEGTAMRLKTATPLW
jgi:FKBP-type peptidyl-prolyl cis-trans isomerase FkpA